MVRNFERRFAAAGSDLPSIRLQALPQVIAIEPFEHPAHSPTERAALQTADIARRLMRGGASCIRRLARGDDEIPLFDEIPLSTTFLDP